MRNMRDTRDGSGSSHTPSRVGRDVDMRDRKPRDGALEQIQLDIEPKVDIQIIAKYKDTGLSGDRVLILVPCRRSERHGQKGSKWQLQNWRLA